MGGIPLNRRELIFGTAAWMTSGACFGKASFAASRRYAETCFGRIVYVERGKGKAALFLHGFPLNSFQWRGALELLSGTRRCIAPDFMALGYTEVAPGQ